MPETEEEILLDPYGYVAVSITDFDSNGLMVMRVTTHLESADSVYYFTNTNFISKGVSE